MTSVSTFPVGGGGMNGLGIKKTDAKSTKYLEDTGMGQGKVWKLGLYSRYR